MDDIATIKLSTGKTLRIDFEHAYDSIAGVFDGLAASSAAIQPMRMVDRLLCCTPDMLMADCLLIREKFATYTKMRRIEEELKRG